MASEQLIQRTLDAIDVKFRADLPTLVSSLNDLKFSVGYDLDAVLRTVLNSTIGGAGPQPLEAEVVDAADYQTKRNAV